MKQPRVLKSAWLVTWEWIGEHARTEEPVAAILNYRWSGARVRKFVEQLYASQAYSVSDKLRVATNAKLSSYPAEFMVIDGVRRYSMIHCGDNPWLHARLVHDLKVETEPDGREILSFQDAGIKA